MEYQRIMDSFRKKTPAGHRPEFRIRKDRLGWMIADGGKDIAVFMPMALDIWSFSPFEPDEKANENPPLKVVDLHTVHNTFINFGMQGWPRHWHKAYPDLEKAIKWKWKKSGGAELEAEVRFDGPEGEFGVWNIRLIYDPQWARYRYLVEVHARKMDNDGMEGFNLMTAGALASCEKKRRWTHSIWENADGKLRRIVHSNALFMATDYGGYRNGGGPWRGRHLSYPQGWVGYAAHKSFNPAIMVHRTNIPIWIATCSQLFDEHICWNAAGQDNLGKDGYFHYEMSLEIVNLDAKLAKRFLGSAEDPVKPTKWHNSSVTLPFHPGVLNSFEKAVDPWAPEDCPIIEIPKDSRNIFWDSGCAHSGKRSIKLVGDVANRKVKLFPCGAVFDVEPYSFYRFSCWVRTKKVERFARLELFSFEYGYTNIIDIAQSEQISGTKGWTLLQVELNTEEESYVMPQFVLHGLGTAWFDDARLEKV